MRVSIGYQGLYNSGAGVKSVRGRMKRKDEEE